jgi:NAD-dependent SIR2 family protein deacetylase
VIIGAGAGLSTSAGFIYNGERFYKYFSDFEEKYHFKDMYSGGFYPYETPEEHWAYWSRYIYINRYMSAPNQVYEKLLSLVKDKEYFVLTTNVDHCFQKAGFDKKRLFYTQGDYGLWQCSEPCHNETYDNKETVLKMLKNQGFEIKDDLSLKIPKGKELKMTVASEFIPKCPKCGKPMSMNLRSDNTFVEDYNWHIAAQRYSEFLEKSQNKKVLFLELGVGYNTPSIIKFSFWEMVSQWKNAIYACINYGEAYAPTEIKSKSICINGDIAEVIR